MIRPHSTREKILDSAEQLFAEKGFSGTSLRAITSRAGVNLAAINYHFRSKDALMQAVFERRLDPVNRERLEVLDALEAGTNPVPIEKLIEAFVRPVLRLRREPNQPAASFLRLLGRMYVDPGDHIGDIFRGQIMHVAARFLAAFRRTLSTVPQEDFFWRVHFLIGAVSHTMAGAFHLQLISNGQCDLSDVEGTIARLVAFTAAGMKAGIEP